jgi:hypothetical protein
MWRVAVVACGGTWYMVDVDTPYLTSDMHGDMYVTDLPSRAASRRQFERFERSSLLLFERDLGRVAVAIHLHRCFGPEQETLNAWLQTRGNTQNKIDRPLANKNARVFRSLLGQGQWLAVVGIKLFGRVFVVATAARPT